LLRSGSLGIAVECPKIVRPAKIHWPIRPRSVIYNLEPMSAKKLADDVNLMTKEFLVQNKLGIHARPAALFVKMANRFSCDIFVEKDGEKINGKSIMGLMMLAAGPGSKLTVHAIGPDASKALAEIEGLIKRKFDEE
jgi:phosphocarrier protein HPr